MCNFPTWNRAVAALTWACWWVLVLAGCQASRPDVPGEIALAAGGVAAEGGGNAIVFRTNTEPIAQASADAPTLSPVEALKLALAHDPRIQSSLAHVRMAEADANQARLLPNPILNIDIRVPQAPGSNTAFEATLTGDLVSLLQKPAQIASADKRLRASASDALTTALDLISEVQQTYAAAQALDAQIDNASRRVQILQQLRDLAQKRLNAFEGTRLDVLTLDSQIMQSTLDISDLRVQRTEQRLNLARLTGQPRSNADWQLSAWQDAPAFSSTISESAWIDAALSHRPEICSRVWELKALGDDLDAAAFSPFVGGEIGGHAERDPDWRAGPTITTPVPIFDFGQASRAKLQAQRIAARHDLEQQQLQVIQDVRLAYATYFAVQQSLGDAQGKLLPLQRQHRDLAERVYQAGETDLTTLLLAESDLQLTLSKIIDLQQKVTVARVKLQRAAGGAGVVERLDQGTIQPATIPATAEGHFSIQTPTSQPATGPVP